MLHLGHELVLAHGVQSAVVVAFNVFPNSFIHDHNNIETWLILDGSMGQNTFRQIEEFNKITKITGLIITKTDSISKNGFIIGILDKYKIPIKFVGTGEKLEDLKPFDYKNFTTELFKD